MRKDGISHDKKHSPNSKKEESRLATRLELKLDLRPSALLETGHERSDLSLPRSLRREANRLKFSF